MTNSRQVRELESALEPRIRSRELREAGGGAVLRAAPRALARTAAFQARRAMNRWRSRQVRATRTIQADTGAWRQLAPVPSGRFESQTAVVGSSIYAFAGFAHEEKINGGTLVFDAAAENWSTAQPMPIAVTHAAAALVGSQVWIVGGYVGDHPGVPTSSVQVYDSEHDSWEEGPPLPVNRGSGAGGVSGGRIHFFGGTHPNRSTDSSDHFVLDPANLESGWQAAAPLPEPRNHLAAAVMTDGIYAIGGQRGHDGDVEDVAFVHVYDPVTDRWQRRADLPAPRNHCEASTFVWRDHIFVAGGYDQWRDLAPQSSVLRYTPALDRWDTAGFLPEPLIGAIVQAVGDRVVCISGAANDRAPVSPETWMYRTPAALLETTLEAS